MVWHINSDGNPGYCKAKKGICPFGGPENHFNTKSEALEGYEQIQKERVEQSFSKNSIPDNSDGKIRSKGSGVALDKQEFNEIVSEVSDSVSDSDWDYIMETADQLIAVAGEGLDQEEDHRSRLERMINNVYSHLSGNNLRSQKLREFLGPEVDLRELSDILIREVGGMTKMEKFAYGKSASAARFLLTNVANDMNKQRYFASVLYFGGRCCYCNRVLRKKPALGPFSENDPWAEGEHINPISPDKETGVEVIYGETRFGNMALACSTCNREKRNLPLKVWLEKTQRLSKTQKMACAKRIESFQKYALYRPNNPKILEEAIDRVRASLDSAERIAPRKYSDKDYYRIRSEINNIYSETREKLNRNLLNLS